MASGLIFITGATGFIGSTTALQALKAGYRLRIALRKESQIEKIKLVFSNYLERLEFVIVPDITAEGAYAGKLDGVDYVLHVASPLASGLDKKNFFPPAEKGTKEIMKESALVKSIKRVVITSSIVALMPLAGVPEGGVIKEDNDWDLSVDQNADFTTYGDFAAFILYAASKILANKASWDFMAMQKPHFSLVTIHPTFVYGHNILQTTAEEITSGTNGILYNTIMNGVSGPTVNCVDVVDVADAHIKSLDFDVVKGNDMFITSAAAPTSADTVTILQKYYPDAGWKLKAETETIAWPVNTTKAEKVLGMKWRSYEQTVKEVMDQQLGFLKASKA